MKKTILTALLIVSITRAFAQNQETKDINTTATKDLKYISAFSSSLTKGQTFSIGTVQPLHYISVGSKVAIILSMDLKPNASNIDSVILYVKKNQLKWLNDSTAIIHKIK